VNATNFVTAVLVFVMYAAVAVHSVVALHRLNLTNTAGGIHIQMQWTRSIALIGIFLVATFWGNFYLYILATSPNTELVGLAYTTRLGHILTGAVLFTIVSLLEIVRQTYARHNGE
jgi:hypothetical protein